jgi:hypothetical protein
MPYSAFVNRSLLLPAVFAVAVAALPAQAQAPRPGQLAPGPGQVAPPAQQPPQTRPPAPGGQQAEQPPPVAPAKPYKAVAVTLPQPSADPSFAAFRKQLGEIASKKDRGALAKLTANNFFWIGDKGDKADKKKPGIENLAAAIELDDKDGSGWETLTEAANEPTLEAVDSVQGRKGIMCSPAAVTFDEAAADAVAKDTGTDPSEWGYTSKAGVEVRAAAKADAPVIEKLGQHLVRIMPEDTDAPEQEQPFLRVVTPAGKVGFVAEEAISPLGIDQLCYVKDGNSWKIAGYAGND